MARKLLRRCATAPSLRLTPKVKTTSSLSLVSLSSSRHHGRLYSSQLIEEFNSPTSAVLTQERGGTGLFGIPGLKAPSDWRLLLKDVGEELEQLVSHIQRRTADNKRCHHTRASLP